MNELTKFLVEGILNEATEKVVALFGGGFKPPTKGHLEVVNNGIKQNPEVTEVKILVGGKERDGFTQDQAVKIWNLYNDLNFISKPATVIPVSSPFSYYKEYLKDNPDNKVYIFIGSREGDEDDKFDVKQRSEFTKKYSDNAIPVEVATAGGVSGTLARKLFKTDIDGFRNMFPENLLDEDFDKILDILNNKSTDNTQKSALRSTEPLTPLDEAIIGDKIKCDNCSWSWKIVDGGDDLFMCHKCGHDNTSQLEEGRKKKKDPKKGTGKKPKGSGRRLYTDENPKDTVGIKFSSKQDIVDTLNKKSFKAKSHARQSQIINLIHQRVRAAYGRAKDPAIKKRLKSGLDYITNKKEASKKKTQRLKKQKLNEFTKSDFNRVLYYRDYFTNLSPSTFDINIVEDDIMISGINKPFPPGFDDTVDTRQVPVNQKLEENIDPKSQKKHKGKSAPFGSAYEPVEEIVPNRGVQGSRYRAIEKRGDKYYYIQDNPFSPGVRQEFGPYKTKAAAKRKMGTFPPAQNYRDITEIDYDSIFRTQAYLKTNTSQRTQGDILSDIRSLPGVTIVGSKDLPNRPSKNESILSVKVDPYPFTKMDNVSAPEAVDYISSEIRKINGVERFQVLKKRVSEGDTYEKMAAKGKKAGSLKQGTVRKRLKIPKDKKIPLSLINKEISRLKKMDKDKDKKGVQLGDKNQKYYKALQLSKTLKTTTNVNENLILERIKLTPDEIVNANKVLEMAKKIFQRGTIKKFKTGRNRGKLKRFETVDKYIPFTSADGKKGKVSFYIDHRMGGSSLAKYDRQEEYSLDDDRIYLSGPFYKSAFSAVPLKVFQEITGGDPDQHLLDAIKHEIIHAKDPNRNQGYLKEPYDPSNPKLYYGSWTEFPTQTGEFLEAISQHAEEKLKNGLNDKEIQVLEKVLQNILDVYAGKEKEFTKETMDFIAGGSKKNIFQSFTKDVINIGGEIANQNTTPGWDSMATSDRYFDKIQKIKKYNPEGYKKFLNDLYKEIKGIEKRVNLDNLENAIKSNIPLKRKFYVGGKGKLNENATYSGKIDYKQQIKDLTKHMIKKGMNILPLPRVIFKHSDVENASQFLGKTAYYSPSDTTIILYTEGRHPKDIARSFAHEMIHHIQNLEGRLENINTTNTNDDDHLNDIEREAYTRGNMVFRNWTDNMDGEEVSSLNENTGDSNPLKLKHIDTWHNGQYKVEDGNIEDGIKLMTQAANEAEKLAREKQDGGIAGEANYYKGTIAWLKKDYNTVKKYINDKFVKLTGNDEVLSRLLKNKDKPYKEAYHLKENTGLNEIGDASSKPFPFKKLDGPSAKDYKEEIKKNKNERSTYRKMYVDIVYGFTTDKGTAYRVNIELGYTGVIIGGIDFMVKTPDGKWSLDDTNRGEQFRVMSTIKDIIFEFIEEWQDYFYIDQLDISPVKSEDGGDDEIENEIDSRRGKLYLEYIRKNLSKLSKPYEVKITNHAFYIKPLFDQIQEEKKKPYKHKHGFDDKLGKDPFGLNQFAREIMGETEKPMAESLEKQEKVRIFNKDCGCDKA